MDGIKYLKYFFRFMFYCKAMKGLPWIQLSQLVPFSSIVQLSQLPVLPSSKSTSFIIFQFYSFLPFVEQDEVNFFEFQVSSKWDEQLIGQSLLDEQKSVASALFCKISFLLIFFKTFTFSCSWLVFLEFLCPYYLACFFNFKHDLHQDPTLCYVII